MSTENEEPITPELDAANARAERAERELAELKEQVERKKRAREVSDATGTPAELLELCSSVDDMESFAMAYQQQKPRIHAAPIAAAQRIVREYNPPVSPREVFAEFMRQHF